MFGFGKPKPEPATVSEKIAAAASESSKSSGDKSGFGFDPSGLERAAKAARELDASSNAKEAFQLAKGQEHTKQLEQQAAMKQYEARSKEMELQIIGRKGEEDRRTLEAQRQQHQQKNEHKDKLERKREADRLAAQEHMRQKAREKDEQSAMRQEEIKRRTAKYEAELRQKTELARVEAETAGRIRQERENRDITMERARLEAQELRETVLETVKLGGSTIGAGIQEFLGDWNKMGKTVFTLSAIALGIYTARTGTGVAGRYIEAQLGKPSLVRETSRKSGLGRFNPITSIKGLFTTQPDVLDGIVFDNRMQGILRNIGQATMNTKRNNAPFRNLLFYGHPGTGKTLFAKSLARHSGLDYAIVTGGDVAPLGREAVTEIHKLFDWSNNQSSKGLLLFVDEADAFLQKRRHGTMSEDVRNALNAFLFRTGEASKNFVVVFASNQPEQFDWAINDRIDEMIEFRLPQAEERLQMLKQHFKTFVFDSSTSAGGGSWNPFRRSSEITVDEEITVERLEDIADQLEGFSGREIMKLSVAWQAAAFGSKDARLSSEMLEDVLQRFLEQHTQKNVWRAIDNEDEIKHEVKPVSSETTDKLVRN